MLRHWMYLKSVLRHKKFVFLEGRKIGVPLWSLILHDWDKFLPWNWIAYADAFYNSDGTSRYQESEAFLEAWNRHQKINKHHYQYWQLRMDRGDLIALHMPQRHRLEMLADWRGAGRAYKPDWTPQSTVEWYMNKREQFETEMHPDTKIWVEIMLGVRETVDLDWYYGTPMHKEITDLLSHFDNISARSLGALYAKRKNGR